MTHLETAIRDAVEKGGYLGHGVYSKLTATHYKYQILLDPAFWMALGKAKEGERRWRRPIEMHQGLPAIPAWQFHWHRLIDTLASGGSIESFFATL